MSALRPLACAVLLSALSVPGPVAAEAPPQPAAKTISATGLPAPGTYEIDPIHSFVFFGASHHVVGLVRGRFDKVTGTITVTADPATCGVDVTVDPTSISTQETERDEDLRSPAYFDVKAFPSVTYRGRGIRRASANSWTLDGTLSLHGVSRVVPLTFSFNGTFSDTKPGHPARVALHGASGVRRGDFGMGARDKGEVGPPPAPDVEIQVDVEADAKGL
jgi:polyisoprenoid-binding protein YceI